MAASGFLFGSVPPSPLGIILISLSSFSFRSKSSSYDDDKIQREARARRRVGRFERERERAIIITLFLPRFLCCPHPKFFTPGLYLESAISEDGTLGVRERAIGNLLPRPIPVACSDRAEVFADT